MIGRPPRSTQSRSSAASDVYKRQGQARRRFHLLPRRTFTPFLVLEQEPAAPDISAPDDPGHSEDGVEGPEGRFSDSGGFRGTRLPVSYTHLRAHETPEHLVCRLLLETKNIYATQSYPSNLTLAIWPR